MSGVNKLRVRYFIFFSLKMGIEQRLPTWLPVPLGLNFWWNLPVDVSACVPSKASHWAFWSACEATRDWLKVINGQTTAWSLTLNCWTGACWLSVNPGLWQTHKELLSYISVCHKGVFSIFETLKSCCQCCEVRFCGLSLFIFLESRGWIITLALSDPADPLIFFLGYCVQGFITP